VPRGIGRRKEDFVIRDKIRRHEQLFRVGQIITSEMNLSHLFEIIMDQTNQIMDTERSTVLLHDDSSDELWSLVATGLKTDEIRIPSDHGVAGWVYGQGSPVCINDAYGDPRFYPEVDRKTGFLTRNILCVPLMNREGNCIGALQALNKRSGPFTAEDKDLLTSISYYVAIALENSRLFEHVKSYSEKLKNTLDHIETLERVKSQLTKFVPSSVVKLLEHDPDRLTFEKTPTDVSILFVDIQGFSRLMEAFDQRLVNDMVEFHFSQYLECIYRHGGEVNETSGDGLMVIFQADTREKHARMAVAAGLDISWENTRLNEEFSYPWGKVVLHLGVNSGEAWVGSTKMKTLTGERWTYTASGLVTVLAARIGAVSSGSRVYVGPETYQYLEGVCECEDLGVQDLKNIAEPMPVYWVKGMKDPGPEGGHGPLTDSGDTHQS
jgi:class 3 adenylate cyclase